MKITIYTLIGMIRLIGFNIQDIQIHVNIQFCNHLRGTKKYYFTLSEHMNDRLLRGVAFGGSCLTSS